MRTRIAPLACLALVFVAVLAVPATVVAQGNGNGNGQGRPKNPKGPTSPAAPSTSAPSSGSTSTPTSAPAPSTPASVPASPVTSEPVATDTISAPDFASTPAVGFRQFGAWLDDTSAPVAGEGFVSVMAGHWRLADVTQTNLPMVSAGIGLSERVQVSASIPFYRVNYQGATSAGLDDVYLSTKITVIDPTLTLSEVGLAVSPVVEILNGGSGGDRVHFAIPVSVEVRRFPFRVYGSAGYFTRGAFFSAGAVEWTSASGTSFSGSLSQSHALNEELTLDSLGVSRTRLDVSGSVGHALGRSAVGSISVGRSLSSIEEGGTKLSIMGGVTFRFSAPRLNR
jgi:hypothetical protein